MSLTMYKSIIPTPSYRYQCMLNINISMKRYFSSTARCADASSVDVNSKVLKLHRSYLYVPSSAERMLQKSLKIEADTIIYDLEDSVAPHQKISARERLSAFLQREDTLIDPERVAVRVNDIETPYFQDDIAALSHIPLVKTLIVPKVHSPEGLDYLYNQATKISTTRQSWQIIASIESARGLWNVGEIARWIPKNNGTMTCVLTALLFAAEDYCADTSIMRTSSRQELLYTRSKIVVAAKAFSLRAIDMVCVNYKDSAVLREESEEARRLGFDGKQAIHPDQLNIIHDTFTPTDKEILRAAKIVHQMEISHKSNRGAFGLDMSDNQGGKEMVDAPMLKQAQSVLRAAQAVGKHIPRINEDTIS